MKLIKTKQGTLDWEKLRETRIGSSEIYDIVRYYATDTELQNCGINAEAFRNEEPYTTAWALYHKMLKDGLYKRASVEPEDAEYGHAVEPYGVHRLNLNRKRKLTPGKVYISDRLIASLDASGVAEDIDRVPYTYGHGTPKPGQKFVCEQKSMRPQAVKNGIPFKYIIQAQYQVLQTKADFFILQIMVLDEDTPFIRGKICQMSRPKRFKYFDEHLSVSNYYFKNNPHLSALIETCINRFFGAVEMLDEPKPFIATDSQQNIIESIRQNALFNDGAVFDIDLKAYLEAKESEDKVKAHRTQELQRLIDTAKEYNVCRFRSPDGTTAQFSKNGRFLVKPPKEVTV